MVYLLCTDGCVCSCKCSKCNTLHFLIIPILHLSTYFLLIWTESRTRHDARGINLTGPSFYSRPHSKLQITLLSWHGWTFFMAKQSMCSRKAAYIRGQAVLLKRTKRTPCVYHLSLLYLVHIVLIVSMLGWNMFWIPTPLLQIASHMDDI